MILVFRQADAEVIRVGHKTATIRFSQQAASAKAGDPLTLACGNRMKPTILRGVITRVLEFDLRQPLEAYAAHLEGDHREEVLEPDASFADPEFLEALGASFSILEPLLDEAVDREAEAVTVIWWKLTEPDQIARAA